MDRRLFLLTLTGLLAAGCSRKARLAALPAGSVVLAFGDSVTFGTGAAPGEDWPTLLAGLSGWQIENAGIPGDTAQAGKQRLPILLEQHRPALVLIEIGGNDFLRRRSQSAVKEDLRQIIQLSTASGARVALVAVPELSLLTVVSRRPSDAEIYRELADEEKVVLIPEVFSDILAQPALCADKIHPNAAGYRQMASAMHARLKVSGLL